MDFSLYGVLECLLPKNLKITGITAENVSNTLIFLYVISYMFNRKAVFLIAFLFVETVALLSPVDYVVGCSMSCKSYEHYYLMCAFLYVLCYWACLRQTKEIKVLSGYVILISFELTMSYYEWTQPKIETIIYQYYEYIIMVVHIYIISTIINKRSLDRICSAISGCFRHKCSDSYYMPFFWYTLQQRNIKDNS